MEVFIVVPARNFGVGMIFAVEMFEYSEDIKIAEDSKLWGV